VSGVDRLTFTELVGLLDATPNSPPSLQSSDDALALTTTDAAGVALTASILFFGS